MIYHLIIEPDLEITSERLRVDVDENGDVTLIQGQDFIVLGPQEFEKVVQFIAQTKTAQTKTETKQ